MWFVDHLPPTHIAKRLGERVFRQQVRAMQLLMAPFRERIDNRFAMRQPVLATFFQTQLRLLLQLIVQLIQLANVIQCPGYRFRLTL